MSRCIEWYICCLLPQPTVFRVRSLFLLKVFNLFFSEDFVRAIRDAKKVQQYVKKGGNLADLPPPPPSENPDYVYCKHCTRRFAPETAARHIPKCATTMNRPAPPKQRAIPLGGQRSRGGGRTTSNQRGGSSRTRYYRWRAQSARLLLKWNVNLRKLVFFEFLHLLYQWLILNSQQHAYSTSYRDPIRAQRNSQGVNMMSPQHTIRWSVDKLEQHWRIFKLLQLRKHATSNLLTSCWPQCRTIMGTTFNKSTELSTSLEIARALSWLEILTMRTHPHFNCHNC